MVRERFCKRARTMNSNPDTPQEQQTRQLRSLLQFAFATQYGQSCEFERLLRLDNASLPRAFAEAVPVASYDDLRPYIMRMINGSRNVLWPGRCRSYAQSSGTSGGKTKYIPITEDSLRRNHFAGASDAVAQYLNLVPESRLFSGKALILGGSFATELSRDVMARGTEVGDLSATLIKRINPLANLFRIPSKKVALMPDWEKKLPLIAQAARHANITNLSGVPSWFLVLLRRIMDDAGVSTLQEIWPNLEVFFHGGISFDPYREQYTAITDPKKMHFLETYNASEGFFAVQNDFADRSMLLLMDRDVYYEFIPYTPGQVGRHDPVTVSEIEPGKVYQLIISASNGLWRYDLGDTVLVTSVNPVKIRIAGRTKCYINAFGEEVMQHHADSAMELTCRQTGASVADYTVAPVYAAPGQLGRHQWFAEWTREPADLKEFAALLDSNLQDICADYQAKRGGNIFLDPAEVITVPRGTFDRWLSTTGSGRLGGQRKIPRLSNDRRIADAILAIAGE